jgi:predicted glycogen debranching enzyme
MSISPTNAWHLALDGTVCHDAQASLDHEWLVTNGLGGYASGSLAGATTRSYHGLLVAALRPPVERSVLVTKVDEEVEVSAGRGAVTLYKLGVNEYQDGTLDPQGYTYLDSFSLDADIPCFIYKLNEHVTLEKRVWMEYGQNTTYTRYELRPMLDEVASRVACSLRLLPF